MAMYSENYTGGTLCGATGKDREVRIDYVCGTTGEFLKVRFERDWVVKGK